MAFWVGSLYILGARSCVIALYVMSIACRYHIVAGIRRAACEKQMCICVIAI